MDLGVDDGSIEVQVTCKWLRFTDVGSLSWQNFLPYSGPRH